MVCLLSKDRAVSVPFEDQSIPAFSPDGKSIAFIRSTSLTTNDIYMSSLSGGEVARLTFDNLTITGLTWTSDGKKIVFSSKRGGNVSYLLRVHVKGGAPVRVGLVGHEVHSPVISHNNRLISGR